MKLYEITTPEGYPQLRHRKDEAKKEDPNFQTVEIDTSLHPLMARLNDLLRRAYGAEKDAAYSGSMLSGCCDIAYDAPPPLADLAALEHVPIYKTSKPTMPPHAARNEAQVAWEEFILDIPEHESYRLEAMRKLLEERQREIGVDG